MARIALDISDPNQRLTLEVMLQAEGHEIVTDAAEVTIADTPAAALAAAATSGALVLTAPSGVPEAVAAMRQGVYGYILLPLQPGEAGLMAARAAAHGGSAAPEPADTEETLLSRDEVEQAHIKRVLRVCKGNQVKAARILGIGRNTLWRKMKSWRTQDDQGD